MSEQELIERIESLETLLKQIIETTQPKQNNCKYTLYTWLEEWLEIYKKPKLKSHSLRSIRICVDNHIKPNIDDKPLNQILGLDIQKALNKIISSRTKKYTYNVYNAAFRQALKLRIVVENPVFSVDKVQHKYKNGKAITREQQTQFYELIKGQKYEALYRFYILSGCRLNEALSLKWSDVDFKNKLVYIRGTKTESSNRALPLFAAIEQLFSKLSRKSEKVFDCSENALKCHFKRLKNKYALNFRIHDLRHTFATRCLESGISLKTIQKWLGHSRLETTSNIYTHVMTDFEKKEIDKYNPNI